MADDFLEKVCKGVMRFPCLWDISSKSFKDSKAKEIAWNTIADEVNLIIMDLYSESGL